MVRSILAGLAAWLCAACSFEALGKGSAGDAATGDATGTGSGGATSGESSSGGSATSPMTSSASTSPGDDASDSSSTATTASQTTGVGEPLLRITDAPAYDFGIVDVGASSMHGFVVENVGDEPATDINVTALGGPFELGASTCGATLPPAESCEVAVSLTPTEFGAVNDALTVDYGPDPDATQVVLEGAGGGTTGNLIANPGCENGSEPPSGWTEVSGQSWYCPNFGGALPAHGGSRLIYPGRDDSVPFYELIQDVALTPWAAAVAQGALRIDAEIWTVSGFPDQDQWRVTLAFRDDAAQLGADVLDTDWQIDPDWTLQSASVHAPPGATRFRVRLRCNLVGGTICDGGFDDVAVTATYDP